MGQQSALHGFLISVFSQEGQGWIRALQPWWSQPDHRLLCKLCLEDIPFSIANNIDSTFCRDSKCPTSNLQSKKGLPWSPVWKRRSDLINGNRNSSQQKLAVKHRKFGLNKEVLIESDAHVKIRKIVQYWWTSRALPSSERPLPGLFTRLLFKLQEPLVLVIILWEHKTPDQAGGHRFHGTLISSSVGPCPVLPIKKGKACTRYDMQELQECFLLVLLHIAGWWFPAQTLWQMYV
jgi:hypothetical protein